jgi:signal transduction histidine kinase
MLVLNAVLSTTNPTFELDVTIAVTTTTAALVGVLAYLFRRAQRPPGPFRYLLFMAFFVTFVLHLCELLRPASWPAARIFLPACYVCGWACCFYKPTASLGRHRIFMNAIVAGSVVMVLVVLKALPEWAYSLTSAALYVFALVAYAGSFVQNRTHYEAVLLPYLISASALGLIGQLVFLGSTLQWWEHVLIAASHLVIAVGFVRGIDRDTWAMAAEIRRRELQAKSLVASNESLEAFVRSASHDLKAPLRHISSFVQFVLSDAQDRLKENERDDLTRVLLAANHMTELLNSLLTFARLGTSSMNLETFPLRELVDAIVKELPSEQEPFVTLGEMQTITGDRNLMKIVLQNLIENGLKYVKDRPPSVFIDSTQTDSGTHILVRDNGIGIERAQWSRIFEPGARAVSESQFTGTGYGLASCARIVRAHRGRIWVESEVGVGSTFHITLPFAPAAEEADEKIFGT